MDRPKIELLVMVVLAPVVLSPSLAQGFHHPPTPLLATEPVDRRGWAVFEFELPYDRSRLDLEWEGTTSFGELLLNGFWLFHDGELVFGQVYYAYGEDEIGELYSRPPSGVAGGVPTVHAKVSGGFSVEGVLNGEAGPGLLGIALTWHNRSAGLYSAVLSAVSDGIVDGSFNVYAPSGTRLIRAASGPEAFLFREQDFSGSTNIGVDGLVRAYIIDENAVTLPIQRRLFGEFRNGYSGGLSSISYEGPEGSAEGDYQYTFAGAASGDYRFRVDSKRDGNWLWLAVADVDLF